MSFNIVIYHADTRFSRAFLSINWPVSHRIESRHAVLFCHRCDVHIANVDFFVIWNNA